MDFRYTAVEKSLNRAEFRWKWLRFLQHGLSLATILCGLVLLLGIALIAGWITSKEWAVTLFGLLGVTGFIALVAVVIAVASRVVDRNWLAATLERVDRRFMDRLNTLLFLEKQRGRSEGAVFESRIAAQTQAVIREKESPSPFPAAPLLARLSTFVLVLSLTIAVYHFYSPWAHLQTSQSAQSKSAGEPAKPLELALPATNNIEERQLWGEVRITNPGTDLKVTKVDVVPLQIEAAANESLRKIGWFSTVNGMIEQPHELPPPAEPRYAVYEPTLYLDELGLSDWDVMTYYAKAHTEKTNSYASEVYFIEVRPFREDILKMPGGESGAAYKCLNELSNLINRQQRVIRETHQHLQKPPEQENLQQQDRKRLADAEADLGQSTGHLYARLATEMENKPIGEALDNLAKAEKSLTKASGLLADNAMTEAPNRERTALSELVAARKMFQKAVSDHPDAFTDKPTDEGGQEPAPVADSSKKLNQMAEFRNESKAGQEFVQKALERQRQLEQQVKNQPQGDYPKLAKEEQTLQQSLADFQQQHPQLFKGAQPETRQTQQAMSKAVDSLAQQNKNARIATQAASQELEKLSSALKNSSAEQQLADAYRLKQMLDQQIRTLDQFSQTGTNHVDPEMRKTGSEAKETINQLKKAAEQEPTRDAFGQALREALSGTNKVNLDSSLNQLDQAQDTTARQQRAREASDSLGKVSQAFAASQPKSLQLAQKADSLKASPQDSFSAGMTELDSLIRQQENNRQVSPQDQSKQGQEALFNLQTGLRSQGGSNERGDQILRKLDAILKSGTPLELEELKKLMDELQHFSVENSERFVKREDKPEVTNIDPSRLPPAYRGRIQKYFQKLSEK